MDWTTLFNLAVSFKSFSLISENFLKKAKMHIGEFEIWKAGSYERIKSQDEQKLKWDFKSSKGNKVLSISKIMITWLISKIWKKNPYYPVSSRY